MTQTTFTTTTVAMRALLLAAALFGAACRPTEGVRCNPLLFEDECSSGLQCTVPAGCANAVCCPKSGTSDEPGCQPCADESPVDLGGGASNPD